MNNDITTITGFDLFLGNFYRAFFGHDPLSLPTSPRSQTITNRKRNHERYAQHEPRYSHEFHDAIIDLDVERSWLL